MTLVHSNKKHPLPQQLAPEDEHCCIRIKLLLGHFKINGGVITKAWKDGTRKEYSTAWEKWYIWCLCRSSNPFHITHNCPDAFHISTDQNDMVLR